MKSGQKGFTIVETLLVLILLAILGFTGYYVWHTQKQTDKTLNTAANEQLAAPAKKTSTNNTKPALTTVAATKLVSEFYAKYYQAQGGGNPNATPNAAQGKALVEQYGTSNLVSYFNSALDSDPMLCAQNVGLVSVTNSQLSGSKAVVSVQEKFASSTANYSVDVVDSGGLKIDAVHCPQP